MLTRIRISNYKSLKDVEIRLANLSVLFGPNAAGKSNFLDCLQLLSKLATSQTIKEAFEPPYRGKPLESFTFGPNGIRGALDQERLSFTIEADVELSDAVVRKVNREIREMRRSGDANAGSYRGAKGSGAVRERKLRYRVTIEMTPKTGVLQVADEYLVALTDKGEPTRRREPFISRKDERLHLRLEGQAHPTYYDRYLDRTVLSMPHYLPHHPHLAAVRKELESWQFFYFEPRERMRVANPVKEARHIGLMGEDLASFLNTLKAREPRQFDAVQHALRMFLPNVEGIGIEVNNLGEVELTLREGGVAIPARVLSEGTLRLLGLLALDGAEEQPSLVGFEEPENGIHPTRIQLVAELLKTRASGDTQYIVTTHSPLLPDQAPADSLYVCKRVQGATRIEPLSSAGELYRRVEVDESLHDTEELSIAERIQRGDFGA